MKRLISSLSLFVVALVHAAGPVSAGGWATTTLDERPAPTAGRTVEVGFTIHQHGVTPVNPEGEVGVVLRSPSGEELFFDAEAVGPVGHHVAEVTFPEAGSWTWAVRQGWFAEHDLGPLEIAPSETAAAWSDRWQVWVGAGLAGMAVIIGAAALTDLRPPLRRHSAAT